MPFQVDGYTMCLRKDTDLARYNSEIRQPIFIIFGVNITEGYVIKWWFAFLPHLTNVSALPGETWTGNYVFFTYCFTNKHKHIQVITLLQLNHSSLLLGHFCISVNVSCYQTRCGCANFVLQQYSQLGQLSLASLRGRLIEYQLRLG